MLETKRRKNRSDKDIEASMASHIDKFYAQIVQSKIEDGLMTGIVLFVVLRFLVIERKEAAMVLIFSITR